MPPKTHRHTALLTPIHPGRLPPGFGTPGTDGTAPCCTTQRNKTHNTDYREVCYPWHPWYGLNVFVLQAITKGGQTSLRCTPDGDTSSRFRDFPLWMFDRGLCSGMRLAQTPWVPVAELRTLRQLLQTARGPDSVVQDQHPPPKSKGDADAQKAPATNDQPAEPVPPAADPADLGQPPAGGGATGHRTARRVARRPTPPTPSTRHAKGGRP